MKTIFKVLIAAIAGLVTAWICYQLFHLDQVITTVVTVLLTSSVYGLLDKVTSKK